MLICQIIKFGIKRGHCKESRYREKPLSGKAVIGKSRYREKPLSGKAVIGKSRYREKPLSGKPVIGKTSYREKAVKALGISHIFFAYRVN